MEGGWRCVGEGQIWSVHWGVGPLQQLVFELLHQSLGLRPSVLQQDLQLVIGGQGQQAGWRCLGLIRRAGNVYSRGRTWQHSVNGQGGDVYCHWHKFIQRRILPGQRGYFWEGKHRKWFRYTNLLELKSKTCSVVLSLQSSHLHSQSKRQTNHPCADW